jgi:hypothetical protein
VAFQEYSPAQLQNLFYQRVGNNTTFWRSQEVGLILKEAFRIFNCLTGYWRDRITMPLTTAGQTWYSTPVGLTYIYRVEINQVPLGSSSLYDLDYGQPTWESDVCTGTDLPQASAFVGLNQFIIWPADSGNTDSLVVEGVQPAPVLTSVGFVDLGKDELVTILDYAQHIAMFKEGGQEFEASQVNFKEFLKDAGERNAVLMQSAKFRRWMGLTSEKARPMRQLDPRVGAR